MSEIGLKGNAKTSDNADYEIILSRGIVCSSDTAIIKKADKLLDLPRHLGVKYQRLPSCEDILGS
jgi:hypothetical protein